MIDNSDQIVARLRGETQFLRRRAWCAWMMKSIATIVAPLFVLAIVDKVWPIREHQAFWLYLSVFTVSITLIIRWFIGFYRHLPDEKDVALIIEKECPTLMDSLICSVELLKKSTWNKSPFKNSLISMVGDNLKTLDIRSSIRTASVSATRLGGLFFLTVALFAGVLVLPLGSKTLAYMKDLLIGKSTGLVVTPGDVEVGQGDDVKIEVQILRGPQKATVTMITDNDETKYAMYKNANGVSTFEIFSVDDDFDYTISTPLIESRTFHVRTYTKPAIITSRIDIAPPQYTRLPKTTVDEIRDLSVPKGSHLTFFVNTNLPVQAILETNGDKKTHFQSRSASEYQCGLQINAHTGFMIQLEDEYGHTGSTDREYTIECIDDFPPVIQTLSPEENAVKKKDSEVSFSFKASDDYGITSFTLFLSVSGTGLQHVELYKQDEETPKETLIAHSLKLAGEVEDGDVIAYYCAASDNAQPEPNIGYSDMRFIEIRPDKPDQEEKQQCAGGKIKRLKVSDLIIEQKHLIRSTWDSKQISDVNDQRNLIDEIAKSASDLRIMSSRRFAELKGESEGIEKDVGSTEKTIDQYQSELTLSSPGLQAEVSVSEVIADGGLVGELFREAVGRIQLAESAGRQASLGIIGVLFEEAIENMQRAEDILKKGLSEESLPFQQHSLSKLVAIEIELEKNTVQSSGGESGEEESSNQEQDVEEQNKRKKEKELAAFLEDTAKSLEKLIQRQQNINDELSRNRNKNDEDYHQFLTKRQNDIYEETDQIRKQLQSVSQTHSASQELGKAIRNMEKVTTDLAEGRMGNGFKHGQLARQFLQRGKALLNDLHETMVGNQLEKVSKMLEAIKRGQGKVSDKTRKLAENGQSSGNSQGLLKSQKNIRQNFDQLLKELKKVAQDMEEANPAAVQELSKALGTAAKDNISGKMKRSENAIRYGRYPRALDYQRQSADSLNTLSDHLQSAMKHDQQLSAEQLSQMLGKVMDDASRVQQTQKSEASPDEKADLYEDINSDLMEITKQLNDKQMDTISMSMANLLAGNSAASENLDKEVLTLLYQTARILESQLMQSTMKKKINLTRLSGQQPPDEYKKLVNKYFKNLSTIN